MSKHATKLNVRGFIALLNGAHFLPVVMRVAKSELRKYAEPPKNKSATPVHTEQLEEEASTALALSWAYLLVTSEQSEISSKHTNKCGGGVWLVVLSINSLYIHCAILSKFHTNPTVEGPTHAMTTPILQPM